MRLFHVVILYREPTFERRTGRRAEPFRGTVEVHAADPDQAVERARGWFQEMESQSWVGWLREIERIEVAELDPCAEAC